jgi:prepilin-type N-terminal cleavage/methylation domain-containing protein
MKFNKKAFTLIELLVVVLIIGILAAVALPQYQKAVEKRRFAEALTLIGTLGRAQDFYKLATGGPSLTFANFDISIPNTTENPTVAGIMAHAAGGILGGQYFDYVISNHPDPFWYSSVVIVRSSGKYKLSGFAYSNGQVFCINAASVPDGMCKTLYNAALYQSDNGGWNLYKMP